MIRILYFSTAHADLGDDGVEAIVAQSQKANADRGVTGALAYNGRNFCQVLEGEEPVVRKLIKTIEKDPRHGGFKILDEKQIESRYFTDWTMKRVSDLDFGEVINAMKA